MDAAGTGGASDLGRRDGPPSATASPVRPAAPLKSYDPRQLGAYDLLGRLGSGGMGTVFLGRGPTGRLVAVKVIRPEFAEVAEFRTQFRREAELARRVARFCTAEVIEVVDGDPAYLVTEYVRGPTLSQAIASRGPLRPGDLERVAVSVAAALAAIHRAGLIHRDLKPANVLLSDLGPRVIDFGIARAAEAVTTMHPAPRSPGTPAFMAPEQANGDPVTTAADIFAWGGLVAFAATGRPPFGEGTSPVQLYRVVHTEPRLDGLDEPLRTVVRRAMSKRPEDRPSADELLIQMIGLPSVTTPPDPDALVADPDVTQITKITRMPRLLDPATPAPGVSERPERPELPSEPPSLAGPDVAGHDVAAHEAAGYGATGYQATSYGATSYDESGLEAVDLDETGYDDAAVPPTAFTPPPTRTTPDLPPPPPETARSPEPTPATPVGPADPSARPAGPPVGPAGPPVGPAGPSARPAGPSARPAGRRRRARRRVVALAVVLAVVIAAAVVVPLALRGGGGPSGPAAAADDVAAHADRLRGSDPALAARLSLAAYRLASTPASDGALVSSFALGASRSAPASEGSVLGAAVSPDGRIAATGGGDSIVRLWDISTGTPRPLATLRGHTNWVPGVAFSPDGHTLASGSVDGSIVLWDVTNPAAPTRLVAFPAGNRGVRRLAFSPNGHLLAVAGLDNTTTLWNAVQRGNPTRVAVLIGHTDVVQDVAFSPDGTLLAAASKDTTIQLWNVSHPAQAALLATIPGHGAYVWSVSFRPAGGLLATGSFDGTVRLYDVSRPRQPQLVTTIATGHHAVYSATFTGTGTLLVTGDDTRLDLWDARDPDHPDRVATTGVPAQPVARVGHDDWVQDARLFDGGRGLLTVYDDGSLRVWTLRPDVLARDACARPADRISPAEWASHIPHEPYRPVC